jgi:hypothetical protein
MSSTGPFVVEPALAVWVGWAGAGGGGACQSCVLTFVEARACQLRACQLRACQLRAHAVAVGCLSRYSDLRFNPSHSSLGDKAVLISGDTFLANIGMDIFGHPNLMLKDCASSLLPR